MRVRALKKIQWYLSRCVNCEEFVDKSIIIKSKAGPKKEVSIEVPKKSGSKERAHVQKMAITKKSIFFVLSS